MSLAYRELDLAANGTQEQIHVLGDPRHLPRPWDPATCRAPLLREEVWTWLDAVVTWLNHEYTWDVHGTVPSCWPRHPHLVHEVAVLADQRRAADGALTSEALEDWHRYSLPYFTERLLLRVKDHCEEGHQPSPSKGRHTRHLSEGSRRGRDDAYMEDLRSL
jgi:hypothetical protein